MSRRFAILAGIGAVALMRRSAPATLLRVELTPPDDQQFAAVLLFNLNHNISPFAEGLVVFPRLVLGWVVPEL